MPSRKRGGWRPGVACWAVLVAGCAPAPLLREDADRVRADLTRIDQTVRRSQTDLAGEIQQADRRTTQALGEIQRSVARLGARLDELARETGQVQGRLDDLRRRLDTLALQLDVTGPAGTGSPSGAGGGPIAQAPPRPAPGSPTSGGPAGGAPPSGGAPPAASAQASTLYQTAYIDYTRGNYNLAIASFKEFIRLYPTTPLAEKAQYWIGESHFSAARSLQAKGERDRAVREFERAGQEFERVLVAYPQGDRVPAALYKQALALVEIGQLTLAEARLQLLIDQYPTSEEGAKAREDLARLKKR